MIGVPEAAQALTQMVAAGVTEGFLAVPTPSGHVVPVTGFELVDDWCVVRPEQQMDVVPDPKRQVREVERDEPTWRVGYMVRDAGHGPFTGGVYYWAAHGDRMAYPWWTPDGHANGAKMDSQLHRPLTVVAAPVDAPLEEYAHLLPPQANP